MGYLQHMKHQQENQEWRLTQSGRTTTVSQRRSRLALSARHAGSQAGTFAGLNNIVELPFADGNGHACVAVSVLGFADLGRDVLVVRGGWWLVSLEPIKHYCWEEAGE